jgi:hypothetical protein
LPFLVQHVAQDLASGDLHARQSASRCLDPARLEPRSWRSGCAPARPIRSARRLAPGHQRGERRRRGRRG